MALSTPCRLSFRGSWLHSILACLGLVVATSTWAAEPASLDALVQRDWVLQEKRLNREAGSPASLKEAIRRASDLLADLRTIHGAGDLAPLAARLDAMKKRAEDSSLDAAARLELYFAIRTLGREIVLRNPLLNAQPIVFMQRRRAVGYMLYEYLGWYYAFGNDPGSGYKNPKFPTPVPGGGVYVLERPGRSLDVRPIVSEQLPPGHFVTLALSPDARTLYFAYANPKGTDAYTLPDYGRVPGEPDVQYNTFHLFSMGIDGANLRQLTAGPFDDFDPCPLPDGGIAFMSTRRGSKLRCGGGSPEMAYTLHRMDGDGRNIQTLSYHETHEWHPSLLNDGRIIYTRWDYVDRNAAKYHSLWTCNIDGTNPAVLFGNYTTLPWACFQARAIPNSNRIVFIAGGHHANVGGTLAILDPSRVAYDPVSGEDRPEAIERLTPEVLFSEAQGWPKSFFYSPWPLSEKHFLVSFSHDPLPGGYTGTHRDSQTGLYYFDRFGNLELLFRKEGISAVYPMPLKPRPTPPVRVGNREMALGDQGEFLLSDVRQSVLPLPAKRTIKQLRIFQLLPKSRTDNSDYPRMGHPEQGLARALLGTVPVESDGSAYFIAPARKALYFQAVDEAGRAVQTMRSIVYLQPGERRACIGCHEPAGSAPVPGTVLAARRPASILQPGPDGTQPFGFPRLIQPHLERYCVRCHDGSTGPDKSPLVLTGQMAGRFSKSYESLKPFLRWPSYDAVSRPGEAGADSSPLSGILTGAAHRKYVDLPDPVLRDFYLWLDAHVPFYGSYEEQDLAAQRLGKRTASPRLE